MDKKKEEMVEKAAEVLSTGAEKLDNVVNKRQDLLGAYSPAVTLGALAILIFAVSKNPGLLVFGALVGSLAFAPKMAKFALAKYKAHQAKKAAEKELAAKVAEAVKNEAKVEEKK
jgi:hypothetical protein